ncbi:hypothetical protein V8C26DRAFT_401325 [Trichoderma gracile]
MISTVYNICVCLRLAKVQLRNSRRLPFHLHSSGLFSTLFYTSIHHTSQASLFNMPHSSTSAVYNSSSLNGPVQPHAQDSHATSHSIAIDRFIGDPDQRRPLGYSAVQSAAEAEAAEKARIVAQLRAFEQQFGSHSESPDEAQTK